MAIIMQYFWFIAVPVNLLNFIIMRKREPNLKFNGYLVVMVLPYFLIGVLQIAGGYNNPFFAIDNPITVFSGLAILTVLIMQILIFLGFASPKRFNLFAIKNISDDSIRLVISIGLALMIVVTQGVIGYLIYTDVYSEIEPIFERLALIAFAIL